MEYVPFEAKQIFTMVKYIYVNSTFSMKDDYFVMFKNLLP